LRDGDDGVDDGDDDDDDTREPATGPFREQHEFSPHSSIVLSSPNPRR
jgi:hypothetical protein